jgi:hypothetical protein
MMSSRRTAVLALVAVPLAAHADPWQVGVDADLAMPISGAPALTDQGDNLPFAMGVALRGGYVFGVAESTRVVAELALHYVRNEPIGTSHSASGVLGWAGARLAYGDRTRVFAGLHIGIGHFSEDVTPDAYSGGYGGVAQTGPALALSAGIDFALGERARLGLRLSYGLLGGTARETANGVATDLDEGALTWLAIGPTLTIGL